MASKLKPAGGQAKVVKGLGEQDQVVAVINSVKAHKKFKQMATYNLTCLCAMITPPNVGWMENIQFAVDSGAIDSIIDVLQHHPAALEVVKISIENLRKLATDAKNSEAMAKSGVIPVALNAMLKSGDEAVAEEGGELIATIAAHAPEALLDSPGTVDSLVGALESGASTKIMAACLNTLDRVARTDRGLDGVKKAGGLKAVLSVIGKGKVCTEEMLRPAFRLLERFARDDEAVKEIRKNGGVQALVAQLEAHSGNEGLLRAGGRLLARIAEDDLENTVQMLNESNLSPEAREFMTALISNLMLRPDNIDKVIKAGGIKAILRGFGQFTDATKEASARALGRMANNPDNIRALINEGAVEVLAGAIKNAGENEGLLAAATRALANMVIDKDTAKEIESRGGADAVLHKLKQHPDLADFAAEALGLFENMARSGHDMSALVGNGLVKAILEAMRANPLSPEVQQRGFGALENLLRDPAQGGKTGAKVSQDILTNNGVAIMGTSLVAQKLESAVVGAGLKALTELLDRDPSKAALKACQAGTMVPSVVAAVYPNLANRVIDDLAKPLLTKLVTVKDAESAVGTVKKNAAAVCSTKSVDATDALNNNLQTVAVFAKVKPLADAMMKAGAAPAVIGAWKDVAQVGADVQLVDDVVDSVSNAIINLAKADPRNLKTLFDNGAIKAMQDSTKLCPQPTCVGSALKVAKVFATPLELKKPCVDQGVIETCANAMRSANSPVVFEPALETVLQLSANDELATAVVNKGAARGVIKGLQDHCTQPEFEHAVELSLMVVEKAAGADPVHNTVPNLVKQGAIGAVIQSMEAWPRNDTIETVGARALAKLLDRQGVADAVDRMKELSSKFAKTKDAALLPELSRATATVGYLALAPQNIELMREKEAPKAVLDMLKSLDLMLPGQADVAQTRKAGFRALGQMASTDPLPKELGVVDYLLKQLKDPKLSPQEKQAALDCIKAMASSASTGEQFINAGAVPEILNLMRQHAHDEGLMTAGLGALASLAESEKGAKELTKGREQLMRWFRDNKDTAGPRAAEAIMSVLGNMALVDGQVPLLMSEGIVDNIIAAMDNHCSDPHNPQPAVLNAAVSLLGRLAVSEQAIKELSNKGALKRAIEIARSSPAYLGDPDAMEALIFLLESCGLVDSVRPDLVRAGATELIMEAMNLNAGNEQVVVTGARALQTLLGSSPDAIKQILADINQLAAKLKLDPQNRDLQDQLDRALQNLANLILVEGLVDGKMGAEIAHTLCDLLGLLNGLPEGAAKSKLVARAVQALGRVPLIEADDMVIDDEAVVKRLFEAMRQNPDDRALVEQCLLAVNNVLLRNPKALKPLCALNGLDDIAKLLQTAADDAKLRDAAFRVWQRAKEILENDPKAVDLATMKSIFKTQQQHNPTDFKDLFKKMGNSGGVDALLRAFGMEPGGQVSADLLRALRETAKQQGVVLDFADPNIIKQLLEILKTKQGLSVPERMLQVERQREAMRVINSLGPNALLELLRQGGVEALLKLMMDNLEDPDMVLQCLNALNKLYGQDMNLVSAQLMKNGAVDKLKEVLKKHGNNPEICREAIKLLSALQQKVGLDKMNLDEETLKLIEGLTVKYGADKLDSKDLLNGLRGLFNMEDPAMISSKLDKLFGMDLQDDIVEKRGEDGKVYYYNKKTGEKMWNKPAAYASVISAMEGLAKLTEAHKDNIGAVNPKTLEAAVAHLQAHANDPNRLAALAKALGTLASNHENRNVIARAGGLQAMCMCLNADDVDADFADAALNFIQQFSKAEQFRPEIEKLGGILSLIQIMLKFIDKQNIVEKCLSALSNLGFNSESSVKEIIRCEGIAATVKVMQRWKDAPSTLQLALVLLNNIMYGSFQNKLRVGKEGYLEVVNVVQRHHKDLRTFNAANRAIGNLSGADNNIRLLVDAHVTKSIVAGMDAFPVDVSAQQIAIDVIGNFASIQEDSYQEKINRGEVPSVFHILVYEGGAARVLKTVKETTEIQLLMSGMDALANLADDRSTCEKLLKLGVVPVVIDAMTAYDWDEELMARTVRLLATLTFNTDGVKEIVDRDGIQILLSGMESHIGEPDFLISAIIAMKNIAYGQPYRTEITRLKGIETVLSCLERHLDHRPLCMEIMFLLIRMTQEQEPSELIASQGMHLLLKCIHGRASDADFLTRAFILLGHLAFQEANLKIIAQYGGVGLILTAICDHAESRDLLIRSVQTLDNIAMASAEHAKVVIAEGGMDTIKVVMEAYADDSELVQVCKSAIMSMTALEQTKAKPRRGIFDKEEIGYAQGEDPLKDHRNLLRAGSILTETSNGGPHTRHMCISPDFSQLQWKDAKKNGRVYSMPLRDIRLVRDTGLEEANSKKKKPELLRSFSIVGRATTLDLIAPTDLEHKAWVAAMTAVLYCVRRDPAWLK
ncbi:hypothetical protein BASA81_002937 [Batrachochytrium salamandrivorans]|nr:hypothetical protein BASA81_002937 [Batrachochytrium salamandrivorans]